MKKILFAVLLFTAVNVNAQDDDKEKVQAAKGVVYGVVSEEKSPVSADEVKNKLVEDKFEGQIKGKVIEVCQAEGCWIRIERANGIPMMVRAKNHAFLMPENIVGKTVLIEGDAKVKEVSVSQLRHYAEDAGKSEKEISEIKEPVKDVEFSAKGVKVLD